MIHKKKTTKGNPIQVWKELGLTYNAYHWQLKRGILRKADVEQLKNDMIKKRAEKVKAIKAKYKNGVPAGEVKRWINGF